MIFSPDRAVTTTLRHSVEVPLSTFSTTGKVTGAAPPSPCRPCCYVRQRRCCSSGTSYPARRCSWSARSPPGSTTWAGGGGPPRLSGSCIRYHERFTLSRTSAVMPGVRADRAPLAADRPRCSAQSPPRPAAAGGRGCRRKRQVAVAIHSGAQEGPSSGGRSHSPPRFVAVSPAGFSMA
jgi:hypothetical protein